MVKHIFLTPNAQQLMIKHALFIIKHYLGTTLEQSWSNLGAILEQSWNKQKKNSDKFAQLK